MIYNIGKIVKKHPPLCAAQRVQKSVNPETKKVTWLQNCGRGPGHFSKSNFKFQMFSNDNKHRDRDAMPDRDDTVDIKFLMTNSVILKERRSAVGIN